MLWAWERPEDLSFIDCQRAGIAVYAEALTLDTYGMHVHPRRQPISLPDGCPTVAVARIEAAEGPIGDDLLEPVGRELVDVAHRPGIRALQVDFDAVVSQRPFYSSLLRWVRQGMPSEVELTITALTSWCLADDWIGGLPIDAAVPMLFQMGSDAERVKAYLDGGGDLRSRVCRSNLGLSTDEWPTAVPRGRRIFVFHPEPWTPSAVSNILERAKSLQ